MKCFTYNHNVMWGSGCGIILAESTERAKELLSVRENTYNDGIPLKNLKIREVDTAKEEILDFGFNPSPAAKYGHSM